MRVAVIAVSVLLGAGSPAFAEIEKLATPCETGFCLHWWPKLGPVQGWTQDRGQSFNYGVNALAPDGATFSNAETVMYAKAIYKPRDPEITSLEELIERDRKDFAANVPGVVIADAAPLTTADGQVLRSITFFPKNDGNFPKNDGNLPKNDGNWERVAYGEEGDFYLIFTISARSLKGYEAHVGAFERMVRSYRESGPVEAQPERPAAPRDEADAE